MDEQEYQKLVSALADDPPRKKEIPERSIYTFDQLVKKREPQLLQPGEPFIHEGALYKILKTTVENAVQKRVTIYLDCECVDLSYAEDGEILMGGTIRRPSSRATRDVRQFAIRWNYA